MKDLSDKKNHLTDKQIWLLKMLFEELGNKSLNEALEQWEQQNEIQGLRQNNKSSNNRGQIISRLEVAGEIKNTESCRAEQAVIQRADDGLKRRRKRFDK